MQAFLLSDVPASRTSIRESLVGSFKVYVCLKRFAKAALSGFEPAVPTFIVPIRTEGFARFTSSRTMIPPFLYASRKFVLQNCGLPSTIVVIPENSVSSVLWLIAVVYTGSPVAAESA